MHEGPRHPARVLEIPKYRWVVILILTKPYDGSEVFVLDAAMRGSMNEYEGKVPAAASL